jgi:hypothetical protein
VVLSCLYRYTLHKSISSVIDAGGGQLNFFFGIVPKLNIKHDDLSLLIIPDLLYAMQIDH